MNGLISDVWAQAAPGAGGGQFQFALLMAAFIAILGSRLNTIHNLHYYIGLMRSLRGAIAAGTLDSWAGQFLATRRAAGAVA